MCVDDAETEEYHKQNKRSPQREKKNRRKVERM